MHKKRSDNMEEYLKNAKKAIIQFIRPDDPEKTMPHRVLRHAVGIAFITQYKAGLIASGMIGSGVLLARQKGTRNDWTGPVAIGTGGLGLGLQAGGTKTNAVIVFNNYAAIDSFASKNQVKLGGDMTVAAGPVGRSSDADIRIGKKVAMCYTYSFNKGIFAGVAFEGVVINTKEKENDAFYNGRMAPAEILSGRVDPPKSARLMELYDILYTFNYEGDWDNQDRELDDKDLKDEPKTKEEKKEEDELDQRKANVEKEKIRDKIHTEERTREYFVPVSDHSKKSKRDKSDDDDSDKDWDKNKDRDNHGKRHGKDNDRDRDLDKDDRKDDLDDRNRKGDRRDDLDDRNREFKDRDRDFSDRDRAVSDRDRDFKERDRDLNDRGNLDTDRDLDRGGRRNDWDRDSDRNLDRRDRLDDSSSGSDPLYKKGDPRDDVDSRKKKDLVE